MKTKKLGSQVNSVFQLFDGVRKQYRMIGHLRVTCIECLAIA